VWAALVSALARSQAMGAYAMTDGRAPIPNAMSYVRTESSPSDELIGKFWASQGFFRSMAILLG